LDRPAFDEIDSVARVRAVVRLHDSVHGGANECNHYPAEERFGIGYRLGTVRDIGGAILASGQCEVLTDGNTEVLRFMRAYTAANGARLTAPLHIETVPGLTIQLSTFQPPGEPRRGLRHLQDAVNIATHSAIYCSKLYMLPRTASSTPRCHHGDLQTMVTRQHRQMQRRKYISRLIVTVRNLWCGWNLCSFCSSLRGSGARLESTYL
jgi:hypothetical protein